MKEKDINKDEQIQEENTSKEAKQKNDVEKKEQVTTDKSNKEETIEDKVEAMGDKLTEMNDKYLRLYSEFENYRRRTNKERLELIENASEALIKDILPIVDDYERALVAIEKVEDEKTKKTLEGLEMIYKKLYSTLERRGLRPIDAKGKDFDESLHEAISQFPASKEEDKGKVIEEVLKGYYLNNKVIRYSKVVVAI